MSRPFVTAHELAPAIPNDAVMARFEFPHPIRQAAIRWRARSAQLTASSIVVSDKMAANSSPP